MNRDKGCFVVLEGIDGSGTTTQARLLTEYLEGDGFSSVVMTAEPSRIGWAGAAIRDRLSSGEGLDPLELANLFAIDREDHVKQVIEPALEKGSVVVCDRYVLSSVVYQGVDPDMKRLVIGLNGRFREPDLTVVLDVSAETAITRIESRGEERSAYETVEGLEKKRAGYREAAKALGNVVIIDGEKEPDQVLAEVIATLNSVN